MELSQTENANNNISEISSSNNSNNSATSETINSSHNESSEPRLTPETKYYPKLRGIPRYFHEEGNYDVVKYGSTKSYATILKSADEVADFLAKTDEKEYKEGYYYSVLKVARERGYFYDVKYKGESLLGYTGIAFELDTRGIGYAFYFDDLDDIKGYIETYYLRDEWVEDAKIRPYMYDFGKQKPEGYYSQEEIDKKESRKKICNIGGTDTATYLIGYNYESLGKVDKNIIFVYDKFLFKFENYVDSTIDIYEIVENLTFEKVYLEE